MKKKIGLALSGGGMRGVAHIGVLQALLEHDIRPNIVSGTSAGAIIGSMYAAGKTPTEMMDFVNKSSIFEVFKPGFPLNGFTSLAYLKEMLSKYIDDDHFETLDLPLYIVVTNLHTGKEEWIHTGDLFDVVTASCSVPILFKPVKIKDNLYVDGGVMNNLPATPLVGKCDVLIGSNLIPIRDEPQVNNFNSALSVAYRIFELSICNNSMASMFHCHALIDHNNISQYSGFSLANSTQLFESGYENTINQIEKIKELCF